VDTSSSAAATRLVVGPAAAALAALIAELISEASAAADINCGSAIKFVIGYSLHDHGFRGAGTVSLERSLKTS
jgi:hypothetical protein